MSAASTPLKNERFLALDSCRGLCACLVAWYHFDKGSGALIAHSYLFVDFFFVLSGFVIAHRYLHRLRDAAQLRRFVILRLGRVYPLHLFVLCCYIALESLKFLPAFSGMSTGHPFHSSDRNAAAIVSNVLLFHSLGIHDSLTWNRPSWSISSEMWCYVLFGVAAMYGLVRRRLLTGVAIGCASIVFLYSPRLMDTTYDFGLVRCVCGFSIGVLCQMAYAAMRTQNWSNDAYGTSTEILVTALAVGFVIAATDLSARTVLAPAVFAPVVLLLSFENGGVSRFLKHPYLQKLGLLSYSIYMTHGLVKDLTDSGVALLERTQHVELSTMTEVAGAGLMRVIGVDRFTMVAASIAMLGITVTISALTFRWVEAPFRDRSRRLADRFGPSSRPTIAAANVGAEPPKDESEQLVQLT